MGWLTRRQSGPAGGAAIERHAAPSLRAGGGHGRLIAADPYRFQVAHRRLAWLLRLSVALNIALACAAVVEADAIGALVPLKQWRWGLIKTASPDERLYEVQPLSTTVDGFSLYAEATAKRFVELALSIDPVSEQERLRAASRLADKRFWKAFRRQHIDTRRMGEALADGLQRTIAVEAVDGIASVGRARKYVVDFIETDRRQGKEIARKRLRAWLSMEVRPHRVREADKYVNPFGLTVTGLTLEQRGT